MIKRLRKRFIRIATLAVTGVMLVLCIALNTANFLSVRAEQQRMLDMICDNPGTLPSAPPGGGQQPGGGRIVKARCRRAHGLGQSGVALRIAGKGKGGDRLQQHGVAQAVRNPEFRAQGPGHAVHQGHGAVGKGQTRLQRGQQAFAPGLGVVGPFPGPGQEADHARGGPQ